METTFLIIAVTSFATAFFSNLLAPRINAWLERRYQDKKILKKTLRTLMEIEVYVQRKLKHPSLSLLSEEFKDRMQKSPNLSKKDIESINVAFLFLTKNQTAIAQMMPDKSEALDKDFTAILSELSTVDPLLTYRISERHVISPIQRMKTFAVELADLFDIKINEADVQKFNDFNESIQSSEIDGMLNELRDDILTVAQKTGRVTLWQVSSHYLKQSQERKKHVKKLTDSFFDEIEKQIKKQAENKQK